MFFNLWLPASRPGSKFRPLDLSSDPSRTSQLGFPSRKWPSTGKFWHHEVAAFSSKTLTISTPTPHHSPPLITRPLNIKIQSKGRRKGFPKGKGGVAENREIVENDKEFKGNSMIPRPPPKPLFPWQHRRLPSPTVASSWKVARRTLWAVARSPSPLCLETVVFGSLAPGEPAWIKVPPAWI